MERAQKARAVDIVVPVYNGYDDLVRCVESLKAHTDLALHRVLLIDDCSPDERVRRYLSDLCRETQTSCGFVRIFNEKNQGFSANVNLGLSWSERDTILLNSDTVVTAGWVEKLIRCAYRSERTATVTPLSNAATLASVPVFLEDNPLPEGFTVDSYGALVERVSLHRYPRVPVGVGFCMYVKQEACEQVGPFDAKTFGRGYGEENDFCFRCAMAGYVHVLCDDTFIYHRGTASFDSEQKRRLVEEHTAILRRRYPAQMEENDRYCRENPDRDIRDNLLLHQLLQNGRRNLLYFLHLDFRQVAKNSIGGTQLHVRDLVRGAMGAYNVFVAARDGSALRLTLYLPTGADNDAEHGQDAVQWDVLQSEESAQERGHLVSLKFPIGEEEPFPVFYEERIAQVLEEILRGFSIDLVHVHHTQGLSLDIFRVCGALGIPVIATLHDYYYACPTTKLLNGENRFCPHAGTYVPASPKDNMRQCRRCLHQTCGYGRVQVMERWRRECANALQNCSRLIFPSESARRIFLEAYPDLAARSIVIPHGTDVAVSGVSLVPQVQKVVRSDRVRTRLDQQPGREGSFHYIAGWATLDGVDNSRTELLVEVTDRIGRVRTMQVRKTARPDVANANADPRLLWSGIHAVFCIPDMAEGAYRLRILVQEDGKTYTDGKVYRGQYRAGAAGLTDAAEPDTARRLNVAFLGGVTPAKGSGLLGDVIGQADESLSLYVFGQVGDPAVLTRKGRAQTAFSGVYRKEDIFDLLRVSRIDVACILPVWAETFCYTLSEAWSCGIPVIGTDIGAVGERIRQTGAGWLVPETCTAQELLQLLEHLRENPAELREKQRAAGALTLRSVEEMNADYAALYSELQEDCAVAPDTLQEAGQDSAGGADTLQRAGQDSAAGANALQTREFLLQGLALANPGVTGRSAAAAMNRLREENEMLKASLEMLQNTTSYRFARRISEANVPFKEPLKKLLKKH